MLIGTGVGGQSEFGSELKTMLVCRLPPALFLADLHIVIVNGHVDFFSLTFQFDFKLILTFFSGFLIAKFLFLLEQ